MANKSQLELFSKDVKAWNRWRDENGSIKVDLSQVLLCSDRMKIPIWHQDILDDFNLSEAKDIHQSSNKK